MFGFLKKLNHQSEAINNYFADAAKVYAFLCDADAGVAALTAAKQGEALEALECENPVAAHFEIGRKVGVSGTPSIMMPNGELLPGYVPAADLIKRLDDQAFVEALSKSIVPLDN